MDTTSITKCLEMLQQGEKAKAVEWFSLDLVLLITAVSAILSMVRIQHGTETNSVAVMGSWNVFVQFHALMPHEETAILDVLEKMVPRKGDDNQYFVAGVPEAIVEMTAMCIKNQVQP